jgi:hypothetical protein
MHHYATATATIDLKSSTIPTDVILDRKRLTTSVICCSHDIQYTDNVVCSLNLIIHYLLYMSTCTECSCTFSILYCIENTVYVPAHKDQLCHSGYVAYKVFLYRQLSVVVMLTMLYHFALGIAIAIVAVLYCSHVL